MNAESWLWMRRSLIESQALRDRVHNALRMPRHESEATLVYCAQELCKIVRGIEERGIIEDLVRSADEASEMVATALSDLQALFSFETVVLSHAGLDHNAATRLSLDMRQMIEGVSFNREYLMRWIDDVRGARAEVCRLGRPMVPANVEMVVRRAWPRISRVSLVIKVTAFGSANLFVLAQYPEPLTALKISAAISSMAMQRIGDLGGDLWFPG